MDIDALRSTLILLSGVILIVTALPYVRDILRRQTRPRVLSWAV